MAPKVQTVWGEGRATFRPQLPFAHEWLSQQLWDEEVEGGTGDRWAHPDAKGRLTPEEETEPRVPGTRRS